MTGVAYPTGHARKSDAWPLPSRISRLARWIHEQIPPVSCALCLSSQLEPHRKEDTNWTSKGLE